MKTGKVNALLIDDESTSLESLAGLLASHCPQVEILEKFSDPVAALKAIPLLQPDVLFLDIQMPTINGLELLEILGQNRCQVIYVTAHEGFAIEALRLHAADYLLKPVAPADLKAAVARLSGPRNASHAPTPTPGDYLRVPNQNGFRLVFVPDIIRIEADNVYSTLVLHGDFPFLVSKGIREFEPLLPSQDFVRVHRSHIISLRHLHAFSVTDGGTATMRNGDVVPVSRRRVKELKNKLDQWSTKLGS